MLLKQNEKKKSHFLRFGGTFGDLASHRSSVVKRIQLQLTVCGISYLNIHTFTVKVIKKEKADV